MSAFICSDYHISALAAFATSRRNEYVIHNNDAVYLTDAEEVANILYQQNLRSVNERYNEQEAGSFTFDRAAIGYTTVHTVAEIIKAAQCYDYQACETEDYSLTLAKQIIEHIISKAIKRLPGYEDAEWGLSSPAPRLAARRAELNAGIRKN